MRESTRLLRDCAIAVGRMSGARDVAFALAEGGASTLLFATEGSAPFKELHAEALPAFAEAGRPARGEPLVRAGLDADVVLLGLQPPRPGSDVSTGDAAPGRRRVDRSGSRDAPMCWVALRYAEGHEEGKGDLRARVEQRARSDSWRSTLEITASACSQARLVSELFEDPLTGLPGRQGLRAALKRALARSARDDVSLALLMINPDQFELVNARFGRLSGDDAMKEFALRLRARVRSDDFLARYGGASFALLLENSGPDEARGIGEGVRNALQKHAYLDGALELGVSAGLAIIEPGETLSESAPSEWLRRADRALCLAKSLGGRRLECWREDMPSTASAGEGELRSLLTGDVDRDFCNMNLLWQVVQLGHATDGIESFLGRTTGILLEQLDLQAAAVAERAPGGSLRILHFQVGRDHALDEFRLEGARLEAALATMTTKSTTTDDDEASHTTCYLVPFFPRAARDGLLLLETSRERALKQPLDTTMLEALAAQIGAALERAWRLDEEKSRDAHDRKKLVRELDELRNAVTSSDLLYRSPAMGSVLETARRVAPTETTVLITGESGVGKEVLARTLHELSRRSDAPLITVDCGAISASLIDSELFGHVKGAFTGADSNRKGRLQEADGCTLFLDEIGELPLESQAKLLRFVQEKQCTPVGGSRPCTVDARILAATNVDLAERVRERRFREDLYHRLHVVHLRVPALRERPEDISHFAEVFVERFGELFEKPGLRLAGDALAAILAHDWPGNVRELHNCLMRAALFCTDLVVRADDLDLARGEIFAGEPRAAVTPSRIAAPGEDIFGALREEIVFQVRENLESPGPRPPIAKWLSWDLVLATDGLAEGVARKAARMLGIAPTTYRRRLARAQRESRGPHAYRSESWPRVTSIIDALMTQQESSAVEALDASVSALVLNVLAEECVGREDAASEMLGVTLSTYLRKLHEERPASIVCS